MNSGYTERLVRFNTSPYYREMVSVVCKKVKGYARVLDVGCGVGSLLCGIKEENPMTSLIGVEPNELSLREAERILPTASLYPAMPTGVTVDYVTCVHVLGHVDNPSETLDEMIGTLTKDGVLILVVPNRLHDWYRWIGNQLSGYKGDPTLHHHWTPLGMKHLLESKNLLAHTEYVGENTTLNLPILKSWVLYTARKIPT